MRLKYQFKLIQLIRNFFVGQDFLDVITPPAVENPGMEVHIHPYQLYSVIKNSPQPLYLHTSPEFCLKELLSNKDEDFNNIFSIGYCFRDEPISPIHRPQFIMLEWYRKFVRYEVIMDDIEQLLTAIIKSDLPIRDEIKGKKLIRKTMKELFQEELGINILDYLEKDSIVDLIKKYPEVPLPFQDQEWDDYFFLLYLNKIEPQLKKYPLLLLYEFPAPLAALSTLKTNDKRVCERFEVYINGIEICNCFNELTNPEEQRKRFQEQSNLKKKIYNYELPQPIKFYHALDQGLPVCSGIAVGVERLLHSLCEIENPFYY